MRPVDCDPVAPDFNLQLSNLAVSRRTCYPFSQTVLARSPLRDRVSLRGVTMAAMLESEENAGRKAEDIRTEYEAVCTYHNFLIGVRFTIAGLYLAGMGFLAQAAFSGQTTTEGKAFLVCLALVIWAACWLLELRSRGLYRNLAQRGKDIEHKEWGMSSRDEWYEGLYSRQYKSPPLGLEKDPNWTKPLPDGTSIFNLDLPPAVSLWISHSNAFDVLYAGTGLMWLVVLCCLLSNFARS